MYHVKWLIVAVPGSIVFTHQSVNTHLASEAAACDASRNAVLMKKVVVQPYQAHHTHFEHLVSLRAMNKIPCFHVLSFHE